MSKDGTGAPTATEPKKTRAPKTSKVDILEKKLEVAGQDIFMLKAQAEGSRATLENVFEILSASTQKDPTTEAAKRIIAKRLGLTTTKEGASPS